MPLNDIQFIQNVVDLQTEMEGQIDRTAAKQKYAEKLLQLIKAYLKSGTVTITGTSNQGAFTGTGQIS
ncbi:hypothetical protein EG352_07240 [Chryseobacterium indologenes]|uniref:Uncharacterized protein n=1 Tax=Chryseobacterium indologenes TaxID=253 RepID=A0AAD0YUA9_CHRID|nr:hypothetical protein [Chryseobacterium indologenes]AZB17573.1 hypothetical protein EG352_07240 [Chryseobacterium indologenes]